MIPQKILYINASDASIRVEDVKDPDIIGPLDFALRPLGRRIIGNRRRHYQTIAPREMLPDRLEHLSRTLDLDGFAPAWRPLGRRRRYECHLVTRLECRPRKRKAHFAAACVGNEAHRINVFPRSTRRNQKMHLSVSSPGLSFPRKRESSSCFSFSTERRFSQSPPEYPAAPTSCRRPRRRRPAAPFPDPSPQNPSS